MNVTEIMAKVDEAIQDDTISPSMADVNAAVAWIAARSYLPSLIVEDAVEFGSVVKTITAATNASPIVLTTDGAHGFSTGAVVVVVDVVGNTAANGTWFIQAPTTETLKLLNSDGNGDYVSGGTVTKRDASVAMPDNYDHDLFEAFSITQQRKMNIRSNLKAMSALYSISERIDGDLVDVAVENNLLYGMPIPQADDIIMCKYYRKPDTMTLISEIPSCIPIHLHEDLIVAYLLSKKWPLKEDGEDGKTPNADRAVQMFNAGMVSLMAYYPRPSIQKPKIARHTQFF